MIDRLRRADEAKVFSRLFAQSKCAQAIVPGNVSATDCGGPHKLKVALETGFDLGRLEGVNLKFDDPSPPVQWNEQSFLHRERIGCIQDRGWFRTKRDGSCKS